MQAIVNPMRFPRTQRQLALARGAFLLAVLAVLGLTGLPGHAQERPLSHTTGVRSMEARANRHALIIGVGQYVQRGIPSLDGVKHDMASARQIAYTMGIPESNIMFVRDQEATAERIRTELQALTQRMQPGDRVFLYYSGHGTRWFSPHLKADGCIEALLTTEGGVLTNVDLAKLLQPISEKADKLLVFYDACHSGGIVHQPLQTRSLVQGGTALVPKFAPSVSPATCSQPANLRTRSLSAEAQRLGDPAENMVHISSSRPDEVSFEDPVHGGLATLSFRDCLLGEAHDSDGSGSITISEITACAQAKLHRRLAGIAGLQAHTMVVSGNRGFIPALFRQESPPTSQAVAAAAPQYSAALPKPPPASANQLQGTHPATTSDATAAVVSTPPAAYAPAGSTDKPSSLPTPPGGVSPVAVFQDILAQADARRKVSIALRQSTLRIGRDTLAMTISSSHDGYVYLVLLGSDQQSFYMLFPNDLDDNNSIKAGKKLVLPRATWRVTAQGPEGTNTLLAVVTASARDWRQLGSGKSGPFLTSLTDSAGKAQLTWLLGTSARYASPECRSGNPRRNLAVAKACADSYGAAVVGVIEQ